MILIRPEVGDFETTGDNLPLAAKPLDLGDTVLRIFKELSGQVTDVNLAEAMASFRAHLKELGFKNVAAFEKKAFVANVEFDGESYNVVSYQKDEHDANVPTDSTKLSPTATSEELGNAILAALGKVGGTPPLKA